MKTLSEEQQLKELSEQVWKSHQYIFSEISHLQSRIYKSKGKLFENRDKTRLMQFDQAELEKIDRHLIDYASEIDGRIKEIQSQTKK